MDDIRVKHEVVDTSPSPELCKSQSQALNSKPVPSPVIDLTGDSDSDSSSSCFYSSSDDDVRGVSDGKRTLAPTGERKPSSKKRRKLEALNVVLPPGFLEPLPQKEVEASRAAKALVVRKVESTPNGNRSAVVRMESCKQFWKAGDYDGNRCSDWDAPSGSMDHVRVHPKFLHSNATSHKWVLGAFAELLDNALDEICNGATYVNLDMIKNMKDGSRMLLIEDNGGGMDPERIRHCMSLGYSVKSKLANTIGQYGNGFKTSTMRLGADVIVFSQSLAKNGGRPTQSIGLLSYTFLRSTGKEDIVVPLLDYERIGQEWRKMTRFSAEDWEKNVETILIWSPFSSEADLLQQFSSMGDQGTRIIVYNLWEDDQGLQELDFDTDKHDIQIRGVNRDEKNIEMAKQYPNSKHFLTYRHSLRSYASILYLRIPVGFRIILRGKDVEHHNVVNDMMMSQEVTYRPQGGVDGVPKDSNMVAVVTIGFVKDAKAHIDVQGFNVYHKNRLIKPFWRLWHAPGSDGRGVIGVLEANFVEPAHDKQGFERTIVLSRLEARLMQMQKTYWSTNCHRIGYAPRRNKKFLEGGEASPDFQSKKKGTPSGNSPTFDLDELCLKKQQGGKVVEKPHKTLENNLDNLPPSNLVGGQRKTLEKRECLVERSSCSRRSCDNNFNTTVPDIPLNSCSHRSSSEMKPLRSNVSDPDGPSTSMVNVICGSEERTLELLKKENDELRERWKRKEEEILGDLLHDLKSEKERRESLETELQEAAKKIDGLNNEQETLIDIFSEERERRDAEEEKLRKQLKDASNTIQELLDRVRLLEKMRPIHPKLER